jgi:hypothetical protein
MADLGSGLFGWRGKCAGKPCRISYIGPELVFRDMDEKSPHNPNEISAFGTEVVFRYIPRESV